MKEKGRHLDSYREQYKFLGKEMQGLWEHTERNLNYLAKVGQNCWKMGIENLKPNNRLPRQSYKTGNVLITIGSIHVSRDRDHETVKPASKHKTIK